jgi:hypothetical protein
MFAVFIPLAIVIPSFVAIIVYFGLLNRPELTNEDFIAQSVFQEEVVFQFLNDINRRDNTENIVTKLDGKKLPIVMDEWLFNPHVNIDNDDKQKITNWSRNTSLLDHTVFMTSKEGGFTNNIDEMWNEDGTVNLYFQYLLREDLEHYMSTYLQRLINPTFGNWEQAQPILFSQSVFPNRGFYLEDDDPNILDDPDNAWRMDWNFPIWRFEDMFTSELWETIETYEDLPIKMDIWNYIGEEILIREDRSDYVWPEFFIGFFGEVQTDNIKIEVEVIDNSYQVWDFWFPVVYKAFVSENKTTEVNGTLYFQLTPNYFTDENPNRLLISDFNLYFT